MTNANLPRLEDTFTAWKTARSSHLRKFKRTKKPYPLYIVAAQGGGIYAAHHTATVLANLNETVPQFNNHLFAISSVSGGSIGAAVYANGLEMGTVLFRGQPLPTHVEHHCQVNSKFGRKGDETQVNLPSHRFRFVQFVDEYILSKDLWSPVAAAIAFPDFVQRFIPKSIPELDRARWNLAWKALGRKAWRDAIPMVGLSMGQH